MKTIKSAAFFIMALNISPTFAIHCHGTIEYTYLQNDGSLYIYGSWRNEHTKICNIDTSWNNISTQVCKGWLSIAQTAKVAKSNVVVHCNDNDVSSCGTISAYNSSPKPTYLMLKP